MSEGKFEIGDVVTLKSGGPPMTIDQVTDRMIEGDDVSYKCKWFSGKKSESEWFSEAALELSESEES